QADYVGYLPSLTLSTNSMTFSVLGHLIATNVDAGGNNGFCVLHGPKSRVSIEADIIICSYSPAQGSPPLIDVMSDLYNFPQNAAILSQDFTLTAKLVSGMIYLGECSAVIDVNTYSNVFFYLDRDTTNNAPAIVFHGREATGAGIYRSRPNQ